MESYDEIVSKALSILEKLSDESYDQSFPSVEDTKIIQETKNPLMHSFVDAHNYLQRSIAIMIESAMSRLYGTKKLLTELKNLYLLMLELPESSHSRSKIKDQLDLMIVKRCKFQKADSIDPAKDWVWHSRRMLPRNKKGNCPQEEWSNLTEDLKTWKLDICFKLLKRANHDGNLIFNSEHVFHISNTSEHLDFNLQPMAKDAADTRNCYAHPPPTSQVVEKYKQQLKTIEELAQLVLQWVEDEDKNVKNIFCCKENLDAIKLCRKRCLAHQAAQWDSVLEGLECLNFNKYGYILLSTPCNKSANVSISSADLAQLSIIPWIAVVDFDTRSREDGVFHSLCELDNSDCKLKDSVLFPGKRIVDVYTIKNMEFASQERSCHVPWVFPHGEEHNQTDKACPHHNHELYRTVVRKPLNEVMKEIATFSSEKQQKVITVVFCYGDYASKKDNDNFLVDLKHLCMNLQDGGGQVIILSDSVSLQEHLKSLPVFVFPLDKFCKNVYSCLCIGEGDLPPVKVPTECGLLPVKFIEDDFELVHEYVFKYEMHKYQIRKKLEMLSCRMQQKDADLIRSEIYAEVQTNFYKGQAVNWISLQKNHIIVRSEEHEITTNIRRMLDDHVSKKTEPSRYILYHSARAGASTLARKVLWNLRMDYPCVILKSNYQYSEETTKHTVGSLKNLFDKTGLPILMLIDEEPFANTVATLTYQAQTDGIPMVFFYVQRLDVDGHEMSKPSLTTKGYKKSLVLKQGLNPKDIDGLKDLLIQLFGKDKFSARKHNLEKLESMMVEPQENDNVTDFNCNGKILSVGRFDTEMHSYYDLEVQWENGTKERCYLSHEKGEIRRKLKRVYLKAEITKLLTSHFYKTFQFYGLVYLDADYHTPMRDHITSCLQSVPSSDLCILANLSVLFAFKVCESIHVKVFQRLCCAIMEIPKTTEFNLEKHISQVTSQFLIVTREGRFRITHPFVAEEIIKYYFTKSFKSPDFISKFFCDFLNLMLPKAKRLNEASQAVNRLLYYREYCRDYTNDDEKSVKRQPFSPLILYVEKHYSPDTVKIILEFAASKINNDHSYGHYARYLSKVVHEFDNALKALEKAEECSSGNSEWAMLYNIEGDIFRDRLEDYLLQAITIDWGKKDNDAFRFHLRACNAYHRSHSCNPKMDHPLFGELTVRLLLLEKMKEAIPKTKFFQVVYSCPDLEVASSIGACHQLLAKLDEFVKSGEGGKDADSYNEIFIKKHKRRLYTVIESKEMYKRDLLDSIDSCKDDKRRTHFVRNYVSYILDDFTPDTNWVYLKGMTEENFRCLDYVDDRDMKNWLLIIRNLPNVATDMRQIEDQLILWQRGSSLNRGKFQSNGLWVSFYLVIFNFVQLVETKEDEVFKYNCVSQVKRFSQRTQQQSIEEKSRARIKEWLHKDGKGFQRLNSGKQKSDDMLRLTGSVVYATKEEARYHKSFTHISWKGLCIFFDPRSSDENFETNDQVEFTVGFSFYGPRAITCYRKRHSSSPIRTFSSPEKYKQKRRNA